MILIDWSDLVFFFVRSSKKITVSSKATTMEGLTMFWISVIAFFFRLLICSDILLLPTSVGALSSSSSSSEKGSHDNDGVYDVVVDDDDNNIIEESRSPRPPPPSLRLPTFIDSHMVLQREPLSSRIWGWTEPGRNVTVTLSAKANDEDDEENSEFQLPPVVIGFSIASSGEEQEDEYFWDGDENGLFMIDLSPQTAGAGHTLLISDGVSTIELADIAFGDVYLCSGQSNMQMAVKGSFNATEEIKDSMNYPNLRLSTVQLVTSDTPESDVQHKGDYTWGRSSPDTVDGNDDFDIFSATCYYFGRELYKSLGSRIPIGLITSCWGGQRVETFSSPEALNDETCGGTIPPDFFQKQDQDPKSRVPPSNLDRTKSNDHFDTGFVEGDGPKSTQLWNAMIHPFLPMRLLGAVWYQGEANSDDPSSYACRFPAMISDWRRRFQLPHLTFLYVELAGFHPGETWPEMRAAQRAANQLPKVGSATAIDLGDPSSTDGSIHPRRKQEVGRRLALQARTIQYNERDGLVASGPQLSGVQFLDTTNESPTTNNSIVLSFVEGTADGLHVNPTPECSLCCSLPPFHVLSNSSGEWVRINSFVVDSVNSEIVLSLGGVRDVVGIRYAWEPYPECIIYSGKGGPDDHLGLPGSSFEWCAVPSGKPKWSGQACQTKASRTVVESISGRLDATE